MFVKATVVSLIFFLYFATGEYVCSNPTRFLGVNGIDEPGYGCSNGAGQCVALVKRCVPSVGATSTWRYGRKVLNNCGMAYGTLIASFCGSNNRYSGNRGHAAIFVGCSGGGIRVIDQWCGQLPHYRILSRKNNGDCSNDANEFYTIEH